MNFIVLLIFLFPVLLLILVTVLIARIIQVVIYNIRVTQNYTRSIEAYKQTHKLSNQDFKLFKASMDELRDQIVRYNAATRKSKQLIAIEKECNGVKSSKKMFQELFENPGHLIQYSTFLYQAMPHAADFSEKLVEIEKAKINNPRIQESVANLLESLRVISTSITDNYEQLIEEDSEDSVLTKQILEKNRD